MGETGTDWEILMTTEVESFLDDLYENDRASHQLVNQAILVLERNGPARSLTPSSSTTTTLPSAGRRGAHDRVPLA